MTFSRIFTHILALVHQSRTSSFKRDDLAPLNMAPDSPEGGWLVNFKDNPINYTLSAHLQRVGQTFQPEWFGCGYYSPNLTDQQIAAIRTDPNIQSVEQDYSVPTTDEDWTPAFPSLEAAVQALGNDTDEQFETPPDRRAIDQDVGWALNYLSSTQKYPPHNAYHYLENSGQGVDVYVVDSGIQRSPGKNKAIFEDRVVNEINQSGDWTFMDWVGHGTMVASIIGSAKYGVAKKPTLRAVKVGRNNLRPSAKAVTMALWRIREHDRKRRDEPGYKGAVINMSISFAHTDSVDNSIRHSWDQGIPVVVAAGNANKDANSAYPCFHKYVICVSAYTENYQKQAYANYGQNVNIWASGKHVGKYNLSGLEDKGTGTSFAAPYVTSIIAICMDWEGASMTAPRAWDMLNLNADSGFLEHLPSGSPNLLANTGYQKSRTGLPYNGAPVHDSGVEPASNVTSSSTTTDTPTSTSATKLCTQIRGQGNCICKDGSTYPVSPTLYTTTWMRDELKLTIDGCPYTAIPTSTSTFIPDPTTTVGIMTEPSFSEGPGIGIVTPAPTSTEQTTTATTTTPRVPANGCPGLIVGGQC